MTESERPIGAAEKYDLLGATQFNLLTACGLRQQHHMLDIGCGSLRGGRLFIPYLLSGHYFGIEPNETLIENGLENELGDGIIEVKHPTFNNTSGFELTVFGRKFDYILAQSIFSHASKPQIQKCFSQARLVMNKDCLFIASFYEGENDYEGTAWNERYASYRFETIAKFAQENGLKIQKIVWPHPNRQTWVLLQLEESTLVPELLVNSSPAFENKVELQRCKQELAIIRKSRYYRVGLYGYEKKENIKDFFHKNRRKGVN